MSYTSGSSAARPPSTTHSFRHATRYQALLSGSGLPTILAQSREPTPPHRASSTRPSLGIGTVLFVLIGRSRFTRPHYGAVYKNLEICI